jgi:signal transduction histidine kinase
MTKQISQVSRVPVRFETLGRSVSLDDAVARVLMMVTREAVYNAVRHAQPQEVKVRVHFAHKSVRVQVMDDGCGFDPEEEALVSDARHFGLLGMRERIEGVGGNFEVTTARGKGTTLSVQVPVRPMNGAKRTTSLEA